MGRPTSTAHDSDRTAIAQPSHRGRVASFVAAVRERPIPLATYRHKLSTASRGAIGACNLGRPPDAIEVPGRRVPLHQVGDDGVEQAPDLRATTAVSREEHPDRVVARPDQTQLCGNGTDRTPRLGEWPPRVVEIERRGNQARVDSGRGLHHRSSIAREVCRNCAESVPSNTTALLVTISHKLLLAALARGRRVTPQRGTGARGRAGAWSLSRSRRGSEARSGTRLPGSRTEASTRSRPSSSRRSAPARARRARR